MRVKQRTIEQQNREADKAWAEYQETGQFVSHEVMSAWLDTWGTEDIRAELIKAEKRGFSTRSPDDIMQSVIERKRQKDKKK